MLWQAAFHHAGRTRLANLKMGCYSIRLPDSHQELRALVVESDLENRLLTLLTNVPILNETIAQQIYNDWRLRGRIEHGYRFDQEQDLDVEDVRAQTVERMGLVFTLVLVAAQFVFRLMKRWLPKAVLWLRKLGGNSA